MCISCLPCCLYCERHGASLQESFFPQSYLTFKQRNISENIDFFVMVCITKYVSFSPYNRFPWWNGPARLKPAVMLFDTVFLSQFERFNKILTICGFQFWNVWMKIQWKFFIGYGNMAFLLKPVFAFFHTFLGVTQEPLDILKIWLFHIKERQKAIQNFLVNLTYFHMTYFANRARLGGQVSMIQAV